MVGLTATPQGVFDWLVWVDLRNVDGATRQFGSVIPYSGNSTPLLENVYLLEGLLGEQVP